MPEFARFTACFTALSVSFTAHIHVSLSIFIAYLTRKIPPLRPTSHEGKSHEPH